MISRVWGKISRRWEEFLQWLWFPHLKMKDVNIHHRSYVGPNTVIGRGTNINGPCYLASNRRTRIKIGRYCAIAHNLRVRVANHKMGYPNMQAKFQRRHGFVPLHKEDGTVTVGHGCWVGDNVIILPGVTVGNGAVIGAGSIVTKDVPSFGIVAGNPASLLRYRFDESVREQLIDIHWWNWSEEKIRKNKSFFNLNLEKADGIDISNHIESP